jgi:hypothetical protein
MSEFKHRAPTETVEISQLWKGILDLLRSGAVVIVGLSGVRSLVSSVRSLRSLLDHRWLRCTDGFSGFETLASLAPQPPGKRSILDQL